MESQVPQVELKVTETQNPIAELYADYTPEMLATLPPETRREVEASRNNVKTPAEPAQNAENTEISAPAAEEVPQVATETAEETVSGEDTAPVDTPQAPAGEVDYGKLLAHHQQRYSTLKGKYDKEIPELARQLQQLKDENAQLKARLNADGDNDSLFGGSEAGQDSGNMRAGSNNSADAKRLAVLEQAGYDREAAQALIEAFGSGSTDPRLDEMARNVDLLRRREEEERERRIEMSLNSALDRRGVSLADLQAQFDVVQDYLQDCTRPDPATNSRISAAEDYRIARERGDVERMADILKNMSDKMREDRIYYVPPTANIPPTGAMNYPAAQDANTVRRGAPSLPRSTGGANPAMPKQRRDASVILAELNAANRKFNSGTGDSLALIRQIERLNKELAGATR